MNGRTGGHCNISPVPGPTAPAGDNKDKAVVNNYLLQRHNIKQIQYSQVNC